MDVIQAKQVQGAVDTRTDQNVEGLKTFMSPVIFDKIGESHSIVITKGELYWVQDTNNYEEDGNFRLRVDRGNLVQQKFFDGTWSNV